MKRIIITLALLLASSTALAGEQSREASYLNALIHDGYTITAPDGKRVIKARDAYFVYPGRFSIDDDSASLGEWSTLHKARQHQTRLQRKGMTSYIVPVVDLITAE